MKPKNLLILALVAALLAGLAVLSNRRSAARRDPASALMGRKLLPDLDVNAVERIEVRSGVGTVTVARAESGWIVPAKYGFPARFENVKRFLLELRDLKIGYAVKADAEQRSRMRLLPPGESSGVDSGDAGHEVALYGAGDKLLARFLVGRTIEQETGAAGPMGMQMGPMATGQFVADADGNVYAIGTALRSVEDDALTWLNRELLNVPATEIAWVESRSATGGVVRLERAGEAFVLPDIGEQEKMVDWKARNTAGALAYLNFRDIAAPDLGDDATGLDAPAVFTAQATNGLVYTMQLGGQPEGDEGRYGRLAVRYDAAADGSTNATAQAAQAKRAAELSARLGTWTFVLDAYNAGNMLPARADLVEARAEEPPATAEPAEGDNVEPDATDAPPAEAGDATPAPEAATEEVP